MNFYKIRLYFKKRVFKNEEEFLAGLKRIGLTLDEITDAHSHEKEHFDKAILLGYNPKYLIDITLFGEIKTGVIVKKISDIRLWDFVKIALAPRSPSLEDYVLADAVKKRCDTMVERYLANGHKEN